MSSFKLGIIQAMLFCLVLLSLVTGGAKKGWGIFIPTRRMTLTTIGVIIILSGLNNFVLGPYMDSRNRSQWFDQFSDANNGYGAVPDGDCINWFNISMYHRNMGIFEALQLGGSGDKFMQPWMVMFTEMIMKGRQITPSHLERPLTPRSLCKSLLPPISVFLKPLAYADYQKTKREITVKDICVRCDPNDSRWIKTGTQMSSDIPPIFSATGYLPIAVQRVIFESQSKAFPQISADLIGQIYSKSTGTNLTKDWLGDKEEPVRWWPYGAGNVATGGGTYQGTWKGQFQEWGTRFSDGTFRYNVPTGSGGVSQPWLLTPGNFLYQKWCFPPDAPFLVSFITNSDKIKDDGFVDNTTPKTRSKKYMENIPGNISPQIFPVLMGQSDFQFGGIFGYLKSLQTSESGGKSSLTGVKNNFLQAWNVLFSADLAWAKHANEWKNDNTDLPLCPQCNLANGAAYTMGGTVNTVSGVAMGALVVGALLSCFFGCEGFAAIAPIMPVLMGTQAANMAGRAGAYASGLSGSSCSISGKGVTEDTTKTSMAEIPCCNKPSADLCKTGCEFIDDESKCNANDDCEWIMGVCKKEKII